MRENEVKNPVCALCQCHIKENALFIDLTDTQLASFKDVVLTNSYRRRQIIFMEGDECTGLYIIRTGRVKVVRTSSAGKEQIIDILSPGDMLGFEVFYDAEKFTNSAVAMDDCELCYIAGAKLFDILDSEPSVARKLIVSMGRELNRAYERIGNLGLYNAREKLAHLLYTLASEYGVASNGSVKLNLAMSRLEIAELLGITQETSIRLLKSFKEEGILEIKRKEIIIKSLDRLKELGE